MRARGACQVRRRVGILRRVSRKDDALRIESFQFHDRATGWELEETRFDAFNLLVGVSGVGKTKIVEALRFVAEVAHGGVHRATINPHAVNDAEWSIRFTHEGSTYEWSASAEPVPDGADPDGDANGSNDSFVFSSETLTRDERENLIERRGQSFVFQGTALPKLRRTESALNLLAPEASVAPAREGLSSLIFSEDRFGITVYSPSIIESAQHTHRTAEAIRADPQLDLPLKAFLTQESSPRDWEEIKNLFVSIFPSVVDLQMFRFHASPLRAGPKAVNQELLNVGLREKTSKDWILGRAISSGMLRTLAHMVNIHLARVGTIILIDDLENSLGKNCLPELVDFILSRAPDLQFIITSHHPYVINNLPVSTWKLVQRRGSRVCAQSARDIPALQRASRVEAFDRLLNLPEYEDGIA